MVNRPALLSPANPRLKAARKLGRRRRDRQSAQRYLIEGPTLVREALRAGVVVHDLFVPEGAALDAELLGEAEAAGAATHTVYADLFDDLTTTMNPQPAVGVAEMGEASVHGVLGDCEDSGSIPAFLVLADISDPGNAGTLMRAAEAAGLHGVIVSAGSVDPYNPKTVRAAAGALFRLPVVVGGPIEECLHELLAAGVTRVGTIVDGAPSMYDTDLVGPVAIVLGNEAHGLDETASVDAHLTIPMAAAPDSLNVAMAGTVVAFEIRRQRSAGASAK